jgi:sulfite reductase beta subunit-like hemoprotein
MTNATNNNRPHFPCEAVPAEGAQARLLGLYPQRQEGLLMQRLKIIGGRLTLAQWRRAAEAALRFTPGIPLHLTTRQDIELNFLRPEDVPALHRALAEEGITTVGACGDTVRAVTVDPLSGLERGSYDLAPLAEVIHTHLQSLPGVFALPRKFKVSLSGSPQGGGRPYINDIALVANTDGTFRAIVAGSLGARPNTGIAAYERVELKDVLALVTAAARLHASESDRQNRSRARLRHVRERLGDAAFLKRLDELFQEEKTKAQPAVPALQQYQGASQPVLWLAAPSGNLDPRDALALIEAAGQRGATLRIGLEHDLVVDGLTRAELPESLRALTETAPVITCPGAHTCSRGITETRGAAAQLSKAIPGASGILAAVSGCPNGCTHPAVAGLGLVGRLKTINGEQRPHYRLLAGGGQGETAELAIELHGAVPLERVGEAAEWLLQEWTNARHGAEERLADFVRRERERLSAQLKELIEGVAEAPHA